MNTFDDYLEKIEKMASDSNTLGLKGGIMGVVLFFLYYQRFTGSKQYEEIALNLLENIPARISVNDPVDYANGIVGIGNVFRFLIEEKFVTIDASDFFDDLDEIVLRKLKSDIVNNELFFHENIVHEDEIWNVKTLLNAQKVMFIDFNYYFYRRREGSIMNSDNKVFRVKSLLEVAKSLYEYTEDMQKRGTSKEGIAGIYRRIFWICHSVGSLVFQNKTTTFFKFDYFSRLLIKVYPALSYSQQRYCLRALCVSLVLSKLDYETSSNLSICD